MDIFSLSLAEAFKSADIWVALSVFGAYLTVDALYAYYTVHTARGKAVRAATAGALTYLILAFGLLSFIENYLYVVPMVCGSWIGTFLTVRLTSR